MAGARGSNSFVDDLIELSGKTDLNEYLKLFVTRQIADRRGFIAKMRPEVNIAKNELGQLNALIAGLEASEDVGEVWDTIMCLRDEQRKAEAKLADLQHWLTDAEEEIVEKQKYHPEEYFDDAHEDDWKRISEKRTKNQAKADKTEHGMKSIKKTAKSKPKSKKVKSQSQPGKSKGQTRTRKT
ncbi:hypothetical protein Tco_0373412 [Tanacetum coccineum]